MQVLTLEEAAIIVDAISPFAVSSRVIQPNRCIRETVTKFSARVVNGLLTFQTINLTESIFLPTNRYDDGDLEYFLIPGRKYRMELSLDGGRTFYNPHGTRLFEPPVLTPKPTWNGTESFAEFQARFLAWLAANPGVPVTADHYRSSRQVTQGTDRIRFVDVNPA